MIWFSRHDLPVHEFVTIFVCKLVTCCWQQKMLRFSWPGSLEKPSLPHKIYGTYCALKFLRSWEISNVWNSIIEEKFQNWSFIFCCYITQMKSFWPPCLWIVTNLPNVCFSWFCLKARLNLRSDHSYLRMRLEVFSVILHLYWASPTEFVDPNCP